ncbi:Pre-SET domain protein [Kalmanozyma brasiliensis GHG001]|uniref:SET domain-containing protein n=1 Tax=Kalmanozyma brasiliensis (strain GHG001) TaxID=1365824 RepID=V5E9X3_KALBG|nr:Pre-SET domain protein [Kalmanozyma brasiliensis GHG001]EST07146.1 Pre-SET domain protein [Kalmanozyma brasiliensis GHG001]
MRDVGDRNGQSSQPVTFASPEIKALSRLRSDPRFLQRVRSADVGQAFQLKLASDDDKPQWFPEYEVLRLVEFFSCWVMEWETGMDGLAIQNPEPKDLGDVIPPWDFIWTDNYLCDPSVAPVSQIPAEPKVNGYEITDELCAMAGCDCEDDVCDPRNCACLRRAADCYPYQGGHYQRMFASSDDTKNASDDEDLGAARRDFVYLKDGSIDKNVLLGTPIFECNKSCSCSSSCRNRVVQKGKKARLAFVKTKEKGWGIKALDIIPERTFVGAYGGELLNDTEAERRAGVYDQKLGTTYLQNVDSHIIKVHLTRQIIEKDLAEKGELNDYRGNNANKLKLVDLVTKAADAIEIYEDYWNFLEAGHPVKDNLYDAEVRVRDKLPPGPEDGRIFARAKNDAYQWALDKARRTRKKHSQKNPEVKMDDPYHPDRDFDHPAWIFLKLGTTEQNDLRRMAVERSNMEDERMVTVDSALWGNHTRFFNHSCDPNICHVPVYTDNASLMRPLLAFFTLREIAPGEELCFSYAGDMGSNEVDVAIAASAPQSPAKGRARAKPTMIHPPSTRPGAETEAAITATEADGAAAAINPAKERFLNIKCKCGAANCTGRVF